MTLTIFISVMLTAFGMATLGVLFVKNSHKNLIKRRSERRALMNRAQTTPLPKMLNTLGIGLGKFFYNLPVNDLQASVSLCEDCPSASICSKKLRVPELNPEDVQFCPNLRYLDPYSRARRIHS